MSSRDGREARELSRHFELLFDKAKEQRSPRRALEAEARRQIRLTAATVGIPSVPPPDLWMLGKSLGVTIRETSLAMKGRVVRDTMTTTIEIEKTLDECEKAFVLAHEIAHLVLENLVPTPHAGTRSVFRNLSYIEIERLCDICAEELLMPLAWLRDLVDPRAPSLAVVEEVARLSHCRLETAASVIIKNGLWSARLFWCTWKNGATIVDRSCPPDEPATLASIHLPIPRVSEASLPSRVTQRDIAVDFGDQRCRYDAEWFILSREKALALLY